MNELLPHTDPLPEANRWKVTVGVDKRTQPYTDAAGIHIAIDPSAVEATMLRLAPDQTGEVHIEAYHEATMRHDTGVRMTDTYGFNFHVPQTDRSLVGIAVAGNKISRKPFMLERSFAPDSEMNDLDVRLEWQHKTQVLDPLGVNAALLHELQHVADRDDSAVIAADREAKRPIRRRYNRAALLASATYFFTAMAVSDPLEAPEGPVVDTLPLEDPGFSEIFASVLSAAPNVNLLDLGLSTIGAGAVAWGIASRGEQKAYQRSVLEQRANDTMRRADEFPTMVTYSVQERTNS